jgi:hypothetical protein
MNIKDLTLRDIDTIKRLFQSDCNQNDDHWEIGKNYFIRTVTHHYTGTLVGVTKQELVMENVDWIADDGRFSTAIKTGNYNEVEPFPDGVVLIGRGAIIDAHITANPLKRIII